MADDEKSPREPEVFLSYSHSDKDLISPLASYIARLGATIWLDSEKLFGGASIVETISEGIARADAYVVFLSPSSTSSKWVRRELNEALALETEKGRPRVIPVLVVPTDLPAQLGGRLYIDATGSHQAAREPLRRALAAALGDGELAPTTDALGKNDVWISSVRFTLFEDTKRAFGSPHAEHSAEEVRQEAGDLLSGLRRKANGVLLNFVSVRDVDWHDPYLKFPNGQINERIDEVGGAFEGTIEFRAIVEVDVINPDEKRLAKLVSTRLGDLGVLGVRYQFSLSQPSPDLPRAALEKLQQTHSILSWDAARGAEVLLPDDVRLTVRTTPEEISVSIETKHPFQLEHRANEFSVREFVDWLRS